MPGQSIARFHARTPGMPGRFERLRFVDEGANDGTPGSGTVNSPANVPLVATQAEPVAFPPNTPWRDMKPEEQVAYWQHQARRHETRAERAADYDTIKAERDELKARTQTETERAIEDAKREAREAAKAEARAEVTPRIVRAEFKAAAAGRIPADRLAVVLDPLDLTKFLTADGGEVDTDKVQQFVDGIAPTPGQKWPDMGQGRREAQKASGVSAGRDLYAGRTKK